MNQSGLPTPRWASVVVVEAVERIKDGTITNYVYDPKTARLVKAVSVSRAKKEKSG